MPMRDVGTILFNDVETSDEGVAIVRGSSTAVALSLSLKSNGDIEVFLNADGAKRLVAALQDAIRMIPQH